MFRCACGVSRVLSVLFLAACAAAPERSEVAGECAAAFGGEVCSWAVMDGVELLEVGATIPISTVESAPADAPFAWPPPTEASVTLPMAEWAGLTHMTINWEAMGHPPATFLVPHFDFHFYMIPEGQRLAIDCTRLDKPTEVPAGYAVPDEHLPPEIAEITGTDTLVGVCVPEMGMHSLSEAQLASEQPFSATMVLGYYERAPIFIEPMVAQSFLLERQPFELAIPDDRNRTGPAPTAFRAEYDEAAQAYRFIFSGFEAR